MSRTRWLFVVASVCALGIILFVSVRVYRFSRVIQDQRESANRVRSLVQAATAYCIKHGGESARDFAQIHEFAVEQGWEGFDEIDLADRFIYISPPESPQDGGPVSACESCFPLILDFALLERGSPGIMVGYWDNRVEFLPLDQLRSWLAESAPELANVFRPID